uniref:Uncharacterized protein n=1 Tax=Meloidogyne javanica TaxID=6303 RepID=A0A915LM15_MELJA
MSPTSSEQAFLSGKNNKEDKLEEFEMASMGAGSNRNVAGSSSIPRRESAKKQSVTSQTFAIQVGSTCCCEDRVLFF